MLIDTQKNRSVSIQSGVNLFHILFRLDSSMWWSNSLVDSALGLLRGPWFDSKLKFRPKLCCSQYPHGFPAQMLNQGDLPIEVHVLSLRLCYSSTSINGIKYPRKWCDDRSVPIASQLRLNLLLLNRLKLKASGKHFFYWLVVEEESKSKRIYLLCTANQFTNNTNTYWVI